jgi:hypothetical protein
LPKEGKNATAPYLELKGKLHMQTWLVKPTVYATKGVVQPLCPGTIPQQQTALLTFGARNTAATKPQRQTDNVSDFPTAAGKWQYLQVKLSCPPIFSG